jgi:hypothetical protein
MTTLAVSFYYTILHITSGVDHPPTSSAEVKDRVELYLYSTSGPSWIVIG